MRPLFLALCLGSSLLLSAPLFSAPALQEGIHYDLITPAVAKTTDKPEIVEVFNFKCPHCAALAPHTAEWAEKNKARFQFRSLPVFWGKQTDLPLRAFFAAEFLGKGEAMKQAIFNAHFNHSADIENKEELVFMAEALGLDGKTFQNQLFAFAVSAKLSQAKALQESYRVSFTPTLVVNGTYQILPSRHAKGENGVDHARLFEIIETLAQK
ncbi:thiol:disulfide interchange protein DsbA/DsbL [Candidatus Magnetaquicoccus inordinatus]|uniref:thiol:disulfide interchange protein DsbA/DsbL n=1 Tax=Candidatus Magnetaquicoccus inordinatus TaxID=2496818 RepID=UPI00102B3B4D|nr:thiol:disulfide interchange protein DsbA/DsbL [Candidatus Magnetaquicoccus inordinatus]